MLTDYKSMLARQGLVFRSSTLARTFTSLPNLSPAVRPPPPAQRSTPVLPHISSSALSSPPRVAQARLAQISRTMSTTHQQIPTEMRAAQILEQGDIGVIEVRQVKVPTPGPGQVLVRVEYAGNNFIDT